MGFIKIGISKYHMVENITNILLEIIGLYRTGYLNRFHVRQMAKMLGRSHVGLLAHLQTLENDKILHVSRMGKNKVYTLNLENSQGREYISMAEKLHSLKHIKKDFFVKKMCDEIAALNTGGCAVLFGSYASGTQTKKSDMDLFYFGNHAEKQDAAINALGKLYGIKMHFVSMSASAFRKSLRKDMPLINEIIKNHIVLHNHDFFVNELWSYYYERRER